MRCRVKRSNTEKWIYVQHIYCMYRRRLTHFSYGCWFLLFCRKVWMGVGGQRVVVIYYTVLATYTAPPPYSPLWRYGRAIGSLEQFGPETHIHMFTNVAVFLYRTWILWFWCWQIHYLGHWKGGGGAENPDFLGPIWHSLPRCHFRAPKSLDD